MQEMRHEKFQANKENQVKTVEIMHKVFAYGMLIEPNILESILGRLPSMTEDKLQGYSIVEDLQNIVQDNLSTVIGKLFEVEDKELKKLDEYKGLDYFRVGRKLVSGDVANVYLLPNFTLKK